MEPIELLNKILGYSSENNYPDVHLNTGNKPFIRDNNGRIISLGDEYPILDNKLVSEFIKIMTSDELFKKFEENLELDISYGFGNGSRYRTNCYVDTRGYNIAMRLIPQKIPVLDELGLGEQVKAMCSKSKGLILITGPTGAGKSTNLASMIDYINENYYKHIITIEDPVEFSFISKKSLINQREIGNHTKGFNQAIRAALREDPDVVVVGEMRDPETIQAAITLAETGHLVFSTLHTNDSVQTVDRIIDVFPGNQQIQIRMQLSQCLIGVISQRLLPRVDIDGRIPAREIMITNDAVKNLIVTKKTHLLYGVIEMGQKTGMILMDKYLLILFKKGKISKETLISNVRDKESVEMMIN